MGNINTNTKAEEFIAKIIHDLKTPINAQIKALESFLYTASDKISQEEKDLIELTLNSCNYMQKLIEIFISVHKLDERKLILNYEKFSICKLIKSIIDELKILLKYYQLEIDFKYENEIVINADKLQIKRVIENLLSNCINHAYQNSTIEINLETKDQILIIEIKSNSDYLEPKVLKEIFEKYKSHSSKYTSMCNGLGLYLSLEIIKAHDGKMIARSYPDDINIFGFEIPLD